MTSPTRVPRTRFALLAGAAALAAATVAAGAVPALLADDRVEVGTGRDLANWPPPRHFDHLHMRLEVDIPSMDTPRLTAVQTLAVTPIGRPRRELVLDAAGMQIQSVAVAGREQAFAHESGKLRITFDKPVPLGERVEVVTRYTLEYPNATGAGLTWTPGREDARSETDRVGQIHTQGQPQSNSLWFPCHDFPNERLTTELIVTVEDGFQAVSNGRLANTTFSKDADGRGRTTWHWVQDKPHANYLVVMVIGKFGIVGLPPAEGEEGPSVPIMVYAPLGSEEKAAAIYAKTPAMISFFEEAFDEPFPWDKYAQLCVRNFFAGGMENTSATTMLVNSLDGPPGSWDGVIAHEIVHQWFGDLVTCKSWEHAWLNEGWASFGEALWEEHAAPPNRSRRAYQRSIAGFLARERANRTPAPMYPGLASNRYNTALEVFMRPNNIYSKGAIVLHMLRMRLGDDVFFRGVRLYLDRFKFREVETDDFRRVLEEVSGQSLERFFEQWVRRPGLPRLDIELEWDEEAGSLRIAAAQTQQIDEHNPAFAFSLPVRIKLEDGSTRTVHLSVDARTSEAAFPLPSKPVDAVVDPEMTVAAPSRVRKPLAMWLRQLDEGESLFAELQAVEHLAEFDDPRATAALLRVASTVSDVAEQAALRDAAGALIARRWVEATAASFHAVTVPLRTAARVR